VSDVSANVESQVLATDPTIGYLVMDLDRRVSEDVRAQVGALDTSIRTAFCTDPTLHGPTPLNSKAFQRTQHLTCSPSRQRNRARPAVPQFLRELRSSDFSGDIQDDIRARLVNAPTTASTRCCRRPSCARERGVTWSC